MSRNNDSQDDPPSGIFSLTENDSDPGKGTRRRSDKIILGSNLAALVSIIFATQNYVGKLETELAVVKIQVASYRETQVEKVREIQNLIEKHFEETNQLRNQIKTDCLK